MFEHLKTYEVGQAKSWLEMPELGDRARLLLSPATESNKPYYNAMLKLSGKRARTMARHGKMSVADLQKNRDEDRILYPKYVISGWEFVETEEDVDLPKEEKVYVEFSLDMARELCRALPAHLFDRIRNHAATPEQFYPDDEIPPDAEELAENSESDSSLS